MRRYTQVVFGLNALYQLVVGGIALFAPALFASLYGVATEALTKELRTVSRGFGGCMVTAAIISALIARNPDATPVLLPIMGALSLLTIVGWGLSVAMGDMTMAQAALDLAVQALLLVAVVLYASKAQKANAETKATAA